jgi:hypothetical protein
VGTLISPAAFVEVKQFGRGDPAVIDHELRHTAYFSGATTEPVPVGTQIFTVAYPLAEVKGVEGAVNILLQSDAYEGKVTGHYPEGRDKVMLPWPCYETDMQILGGASGGPVMISGSSGIVFAINCSSFGPDSVSYVSSLAPLVKGR